MLIGVDSCYDGINKKCILCSHISRGSNHTYPERHSCKKTFFRLFIHILWWNTNLNKINAHVIRVECLRSCAGGINHILKFINELLMS